MVSIATVETEINELAVKWYITNPAGDVGQDLTHRGMRVMAGAIMQVGVDKGDLRASIHLDRGVDRLGQYVAVVASDPIATIHHNGTAPHLITPIAHKVLRFNGRSGVVHAARVHHPGTLANPFLTDNLRRAV